MRTWRETMSAGWVLTTGGTERRGSDVLSTVPVDDDTDGLCEKTMVSMYVKEEDQHGLPSTRRT